MERTGLVARSTYLGRGVGEKEEIMHAGQGQMDPKKNAEKQKRPSGVRPPA